MSISLLGIGYYFYSRKPVSTEPTSVVETAETPAKGCEPQITDEVTIVTVNKFRAEAGVKPLVFRKKLDDFANQRALEQEGVLDSHAGLQPLLDKVRMGLYALVGEDQILSSPCFTNEEWVAQFKISPKHWASLMNSRYDEIGVGFYKNILVIDLGDLK